MIFDFLCDEYNGNLQDIVVPDTINGIKVSEFDSYAFAYGGLFDTNIKSIYIPDSITTIPYKFFENYPELENVVANGVTVIEDEAFSGCTGLKNIKTSQLQSVGEYAFYNCTSLSYFPYLEEIKIISAYAFDNCTSLKSINLSNAEKIGNNVFRHCSNLEIIIAPNVIEIGDMAFSDTISLKKIDLPLYTNSTKGKIFENSGIKNIQLNVEKIEDASVFKGCQLEYLYLPNVSSSGLFTIPCERIELEKVQTLFLSCNSKQIIAIPSTCNKITNINKKISNDYIVYGTIDSFAYNWCTENGVTFKNISQETAVMTDLPMEITDADTELVADVIGFNRTYQWYSNDVADNTTGTAIDGATSKYFTPSDYPLADYYYCVVTSTDGNYEPVTIRTGVTKSNIPVVTEPSTEPTTQQSTEPTTQPSTVPTTMLSTNKIEVTTSKKHNHENKNDSLISPNTGNSTFHISIIASVTFSFILFLIVKKHINVSDAN